MTYVLQSAEPPVLSPPLALHEVGAETYRDRLTRVRGRMADENLDVLAVYGDREHVGNIHFLDGFDPRFEEALLVLHRDGRACLMLGNEGMGYAAVSPLGLDTLLCQSFSLLGQARGTAPSVEAVLREAGITSGATVGAVGWKYFLDDEADEPRLTLDLPSFIADALRRVAGPQNVVNATHLLMHPDTGLRTRVELDQLLAFAPVCQRASHGIFHAIDGLRPGETEADLAKRFAYDGRPMNYHPIVTSGERTSLGLASPSSRTVNRGDTLFMAMGGWGANSVRGGYVLASPDELAAVDPGYLDDVVSPYLDMVAAWYEAVGEGAVAGDVHAEVVDKVAGRIEGMALNPGHHIHIDEWVSSPFEAGSTTELASGMMIQMDIIPKVAGGGFGTNAEDGIVLADAGLRAEIERTAPALWSAIVARRSYMADVAGLLLHESVLPLSDIQGWVAPLLLSPNLVMVRAD